MSEYALYGMERNAYLGECIVVVCRASAEEAKRDSLQSDSIVLLIKAQPGVSRIHTLNQLRVADLFDSSVTPLLRVSSECLLGVFGDSHCDCDAQRVGSLREIATVGQGVYVHLPQEGQGHGLFYKAQELNLQVSGVAPDGGAVGPKSVDEAARYLLGPGVELDQRNYTALSRIFMETGLNRYSYAVITDSPGKTAFIEEVLGISVAEHHPARRPITVENAGEYLAKLYRKNYTLTDQELEEIYLCLFNAEQIPGRVLGLLRSMAEDMHHGKEFSGNQEVLRRLIRVSAARGGGAPEVSDIGGLRGVASYEEYQVELALAERAAEELFAKHILNGIDSLRYEENHFYDVASFEGVPTRSLKIRYAYRISDRTTPTEIRFIYKIPLGDKEYRIRALDVKYDDIAMILGFVLRDYEQHLVPVFTHNVFGGDADVTTLIKRYSATLRTLSLMGPRERVTKLVADVNGVVNAPEIPDPSNALFLNRKLSLEFDYNSLAREELALYRRHCVG